MSSEADTGEFDRKAFKQAFDDHARQVRNFIYYKCGDVDQAEDIMQEAFLRLWQQREKIDPARVKAFLFTVANNLFLDAARREKVALKFQQQPQRQSDGENPQHVLEQKEFMERLQSAINDLSEGQREVFLLNRIEKLTYKEIAERLDVSVKAVEKRMGKALAKMRKLIKNI